MKWGLSEYIVQATIHMKNGYHINHQCTAVGPNQLEATTKLKHMLAATIPGLRDVRIENIKCIGDGA